MLLHFAESQIPGKVFALESSLSKLAQHRKKNNCTKGTDNNI